MVSKAAASAKAKQVPQNLTMWAFFIYHLYVKFFEIHSKMVKSRIEQCHFISQKYHVEVCGIGACCPLRIRIIGSKDQPPVGALEGASHKNILYTGLYFYDMAHMMFLLNK